MPVDHTIGIAGLRADEYVDVVSYLLQVNALPAGRELTRDVTAMK